MVSFLQTLKVQHVFSLAKKNTYFRLKGKQCGAVDGRTSVIISQISQKKQEEKNRAHVSSAWPDEAGIFLLNCEEAELKSLKR